MQFVDKVFCMIPIYFCTLCTACYIPYRIPDFVFSRFILAVRNSIIIFSLSQSQSGAEFLFLPFIDIEAEVAWFFYVQIFRNFTAFVLYYTFNISKRNGVQICSSFNLTLLIGWGLNT